jgi:DNA-binding CsgD family transcriptional regulator
MNETPRLSPKSRQVLKLIAKGHSYAQIVDGNPTLNYHDIFFAAEEAVWLDERIGNMDQGSDNPPSRPTSISAMERAKEKFPRAYALWSEREDAELASMHAAGKSKKDIAIHFQRQPSAVESRLRKLGLIQP